MMAAAMAAMGQPSFMLPRVGSDGSNATLTAGDIVGHFLQSQPLPVLPAAAPPAAASPPPSAPAQATTAAQAEQAAAGSGGDATGGIPGSEDRSATLSVEQTATAMAAVEAAAQADGEAAASSGGLGAACAASEGATEAAAGPARAAQTPPPAAAAGAPPPAAAATAAAAQQQAALVAQLMRAQVAAATSGLQPGLGASGRLTAQGLPLMLEMLRQAGQQQLGGMATQKAASASARGCILRHALLDTTSTPSPLICSHSVQTACGGSNQSSPSLALPPAG
jgi:hypothetical protein